MPEYAWKRLLDGDGDEYEETHLSKKTSSDQEIVGILYITVNEFRSFGLASFELPLLPCTCFFEIPPVGAQKLDVRLLPSIYTIINTALHRGSMIPYVITASGHSMEPEQSRERSMGPRVTARRRPTPK